MVGNTLDRKERRIKHEWHNGRITSTTVNLYAREAQRGIEWIILIEGWLRVTVCGHTFLPWPATILAVVIAWLRPHLIKLFGRQGVMKHQCVTTTRSPYFRLPSMKDSIWGAKYDSSNSQTFLRQILWHWIVSIDVSDIVGYLNSGLGVLWIMPGKFWGTLVVCPHYSALATDRCHKTTQA